MKSLIAGLFIAGVMALGLAASVSAGDAKGLPMVQGEIKKVDQSSGKVTIKAAAIPNLEMDAMTMVFRAEDPAMLKDMKPGDEIMFAADLVNGHATVVKIKKGK